MKNYTEQELNDFSFKAIKYFIKKLKEKCSHFKVLTDELVKIDSFGKIGFKVLVEGFVTSNEKSIIEIECYRNFHVFESGSVINTFTINIKENEFLIIKAFEIFSLIYYELKKKYKIELEIFRDKENKIFLKFGDKVKKIKKYTSMDYEKSLKFFEKVKND